VQERAAVERDAALAKPELVQRPVHELAERLPLRRQEMPDLGQRRRDQLVSDRAHGVGVAELLGVGDLAAAR
jgi:hypothetical protein